MKRKNNRVLCESSVRSVPSVVVVGSSAVCYNQWLTTFQPQSSQRTHRETPSRLCVFVPLCLCGEGG